MIVDQKIYRLAYHTRLVSMKRLNVISTAVQMFEKNHKNFQRQTYIAEDRRINKLSIMDYSKLGNMMEKNRIDSFKKWPFDDKSPCSVKKMAEAGFYWSGSEREPDTATCFICNKTLDGWEQTDDPWKEHAKHAPQCNFVKYGRKEADLTVQEFINIFSVALKSRMERNFNKTLDEFRKWAEKEKEKVLLGK